MRTSSRSKSRRSPAIDRPDIYARIEESLPIARKLLADSGFGDTEGLLESIPAVTPALASDDDAAPLNDWTDATYALGIAVGLLLNPTVVLGPRGRNAVKAALYGRVSTFDQEPENQLQELRRYAAARGWAAAEYVDRGISGTKDRRPALDELLKDARRRRFDVLICWRLDRLGRNLKHLITMLEEVSALGIAFVSLNEGIDATTPAGKLQLHILGAIAEFERARIAERVTAGLQRARAQGKRLGRPRKAPPAIAVPGGSVRDAARAWGVSKSTAARWIAAGHEPTQRRKVAPSAA